MRNVHQGRRVGKTGKTGGAPVHMYAYVHCMYIISCKSLVMCTFPRAYNSTITVRAPL